mmetsp:Transcript_10006/g.22419  ORF Transcript_10006/g.22419 Transcript_10006/m.22419 type:complete len:609 (+) Transcript_10006:113-1939(+)|eukprot:CAMPEP_0178428262 /NCGR_PEP_ID=MMETSP0689_2-20121128/30185_1 /TAXON_ID=160604 /ORGANISM="Amphidinium massartii, Strain CS-259" /LENGTH=608 /DNA_ID=CAMNT_0020050025 /DNA_START=30 /DNA_END=1856 /DNA_ORIENTATION=-
MALSMVDALSSSSALENAVPASLTVMDIILLVLAMMAVLVITAMKLPYFRPVKGRPYRRSSLQSIAVCEKHTALSNSSPRRSQNNARFEKQGSSAKVSKATVAPLVAPTFEADTFCGQVDEFLQKVAVSAESEAILQKLRSHVKSALAEIFPEVSIAVFANSNIMSGTAYGVAVPEVDIVANVGPDGMVQDLQKHWPKMDLSTLPFVKLQKCAIRTCTELLTTSGGLKFRRSCFRGDEPKVTLLVPASLGIHTESIPIDFSLNCVGPLQSAALLTECGQYDPRVRELILLVRRWAKDRGLSHAASGRLSPYAWMLLCIYFCQVGMRQLAGPLLPPIVAFKSAARLGPHTGAGACPITPKQWQRMAQSRPSLTNLPVGELFRRFLHFYAQEMQWSKEGVSPLHGLRASVPLGMNLHIVVAEDGSSEVGPSIEDPFQPERNLGSSLSSQGWTRVQEELKRARDLVVAGAPLSELLEPWMPPRDRDEATPERSEEDASRNNPRLSRRQSLDSGCFPPAREANKHMRAGEQIGQRRTSQVSCSSASSSCWSCEEEERDLHNRLGKAVFDRLCAQGEVQALQVAQSFLQESKEDWRLNDSGAHIMGFVDKVRT